MAVLIVGLLCLTVGRVTFFTIGWMVQRPAEAHPAKQLPETVVRKSYRLN